MSWNTITRKRAIRYRLENDLRRYRLRINRINQLIRWLTNNQNNTRLSLLARTRFANRITQLNRERRQIIEYAQADLQELRRL